MSDRITRRRLLLVGAFATVGLSGCSGDGSDGTDGDDGNDGSDGSGGSDGGNADPTATATPTPTETDAPTATDTATAADTATATPPATATRTSSTAATTAGDSGDLGDPMGSVAAETVEGLEIVQLNSLVAGSGHNLLTEGDWGIVVTIENTGDQATNYFDGYTWRMTAYDDAGTDLFGRNYTTTARGENPTVDPGSTAKLAIFPRDQSATDQVAEYEVSLTCEGMFADGVYCE